MLMRQAPGQRAYGGCETGEPRGLGGGGSGFPKSRGKVGSDSTDTGLATVMPHLIHLRKQLAARTPHTREKVAKVPPGLHSGHRQPGLCPALGTADYSRYQSLHPPVSSSRIRIRFTNSNNACPDSYLYFSHSYAKGL